MPYGDVLNARLLLFNLCNCMLEAIRESLPLGLKFYPTMLKLAVAIIIDCLPVIINNEVSDVNIVLCQSLNRVENLFFSEPLAKCIPCAYKRPSLDSFSDIE